MIHSYLCFQKDIFGILLLLNKFARLLFGKKKLCLLLNLNDNKFNLFISTILPIDKLNWIYIYIFKYEKLFSSNFCSSLRSNFYYFKVIQSLDFRVQDLGFWGSFLGFQKDLGFHIWGLKFLMVYLILTIRLNT